MAERRSPRSDTVTLYSSYLDRSFRNDESLSSAPVSAQWPPPLSTPSCYCCPFSLPTSSSLPSAGLCLFSFLKGPECEGGVEKTAG